MKPLRKFSSKTEVLAMTIMSGALDKSVSDGNTNLLEISEESNIQRYVYIGGDMVCSFLTIANFYKYISNMGNNLTPYSIAKGQ